MFKERGEDPNVIDNEQTIEKYGGTSEKQKLRVEQKERFAEKRAIEKEADQR